MSSWPAGAEPDTFFCDFRVSSLVDLSNVVLSALSGRSRTRRMPGDSLDRPHRKWYRERVQQRQPRPSKRPVFGLSTSNAQGRACLAKVRATSVSIYLKVIVFNSMVNVLVWCWVFASSFFFTCLPHTPQGRTTEPRRSIPPWRSGSYLKNRHNRHYLWFCYFCWNDAQGKINVERTKTKRARAGRRRRGRRYVVVG